PYVPGQNGDSERPGEPTICQEHDWQTGAVMRAWAMNEMPRSFGSTLGPVLAEPGGQVIVWFPNENDRSQDRVQVRNASGSLVFEHKGFIQGIRALRDG